MALTQAVIQTTTGVSSGNVDFTSAGFGLPEAAIVIVGHIAGAPGNISLSYGFTDGVNQRLSAVSHGEGGSLGERCHSISRIYQLCGAAEHATFDSFVTDGIRLNFPVAPGASRPVTIILFKGGQFSVGHRVITSGVESVALGFQPNLVFTSCVGMNASFDIATSNGIFALGAIHEDAGTVTQYTAAYVSNGSSRSIAGAVGAWATCQIFSGSTPTWSSTMENFSATGFDFNTSGTAGDAVHYLAIDSLGAGVSIEQVGSAAGSVVNTAPGFTPDFLMMLSTGNFAIGSVSTGDLRALYGVSANSPSVSSSISLAADVSAAPELSETYSSSMVSDLNLMNGGGTSDFVKSTLTSFDATGYTLNYTVAPATPRLLIAVAIEEPAATTAIEVPVGNVPISAFPPIIELPSIIIPPNGLIAILGFAPAVGSPITIIPAAGFIGISGLAPTIGSSVTIIPDTGLINLVGFAPTLDSPIIVVPPVGVIEISGAAPTLSTPVTINLVTGDIGIQGEAPAVLTPSTIIIGTGEVIITGIAPILTAGQIITPPSGQVIIAGVVPSILSSVTISPGVGVIDIDGFAPTVISGIPTPASRQIILTRDSTIGIDRVIIALATSIIIT